MISHIARCLVFAVLPLALGACSLSSAPHAPGELGREYAATIPGTWMGEVSGGGITCRMVKEISPNGNARGVMLMKKRSGSVSLVLPEVPFSSRWKVVGDVVETYAIKTGIPGMFKSGEVIRDTIVSVSPNRIVCRSNASGELEVIERLRSGR